MQMILRCGVRVSPHRYYDVCLGSGGDDSNQSSPRELPAAPTLLGNETTLAAQTEDCSFVGNAIDVEAPLPRLGPRYRLLSFLGHGGMGNVYAAHDEYLDEAVAVKVLRASLGDDSAFRAKLSHEVRLARRVSHPNVCRVHDLGQHEAQVFITMELIEGCSLRSVIRKIRDGDAPPFALARVLDIVSQLGAGLAVAHQAGVVHRDVKPDNVMLSEQRVVLTDFGIATLIGTAHELTGTPAYLAPEIVRADRFDHRADVYALAVMSYELMAGVRPFAIHTFAEALNHAAGRSVYPGLPQALASASVRAELDGVIAAALCIDPHRRVANVGELVAGLARAAAGGVGAKALRGSDVAGAQPLSTGLRWAESRSAVLVHYRSQQFDERVLTVLAEAGGNIVQHHDGSVDALFGVPVSFGDDAERATRAAGRIVSGTDAVALVDVRRVTVRDGKADSALPTPQLESRLAQLALGTVGATSAIARLLAGRFELTATDRGFVVGRSSRAQIDPATFVRHREMARVAQAIEAGLRARSPVVVEIHGASGSGKGQLLEALVADLAHRRQVDWLFAQASPLAESAPLAMIRDAHASWFDAAMATTGDRVGILAAARKWLVDRAISVPTIVVVENWQWADEMSRALMASLHGSAGVPVAIVGLVRTDGPRAPIRAIDPNAVVVELGPLDDQAAAALVTTYCPTASQHAISQVVARAAGNRLFLEEFARELDDGNATTSQLSATVEAILSARLDRLPEHVVQVATMAALIGSRFSREELALLVDDTDGALDSALFTLQETGIIAAVANRLHFVQALFAEVARARLLPADRVPMHRTLAQWYEARGRRSNPVDVEPLLAAAHHLLESGNPAAAQVVFREVGLANLELFAYREARNALQKAVELHPSPDAELLDRASEATFAVDGKEAATALVNRALACCEGPPPLRARLLARAGFIAGTSGDSAPATGYYEQGLALAMRCVDGDFATGTLEPWAVEDPRIAAVLLSGLGWTRGYQCGLATGHPLCERAVALLTDTPHRRELAHALSRLGATYMRASQFRDQLGCNQRNLAIAIELRDLWMQTTAHINLGVVFSILGDNDRAREHTQHAYLHARRMNADSTVGLVASNMAGYLLELPGFAGARAFLDEATETLERTGKRYVLVETYGFEARLQVMLGDRTTAERFALAACALADELGHGLDACVARRIHALVVAPRDAQQALSVLEQQAAPLTELDRFEAARNDAALARVHTMLGNVTDAAECRARAATFFRDHGNLRELAMLDQTEAVR